MNNLQNSTRQRGDEASATSAAAVPVIVGQNGFRYQAMIDWARLPEGYSWREVAAVACDESGRAFVFNRGEHPMMVFDRDGTFLTSWGEGLFVRAHGVVLGSDGSLFCTEDHGHTVRKFTPEGRLLMTLGVPGKPSETGATSMDFRSIRQAAGPFHYPTNLAVARNGDLFVADGYGNARIHHFAPDGRLLNSWGEPGGGPGQFRIPHGIAIDPEGLLFVADRENSRIQVFTDGGVFVRELTDIARPCEVAFDPEGNLFIAELGYRAGMWSGIPAPHPAATGGRVTILNPRGEVLARWGGGDRPTEAGDFFAPHDIALDGFGDLYVSEVVRSAAGDLGTASGVPHSLQKFVRLR